MAIFNSYVSLPEGTDRLIQTPECMMKRTIHLLCFSVSSSLQRLPIYMSFRSP